MQLKRISLYALQLHKRLNEALFVLYGVHIAFNMAEPAFSKSQDVDNGSQQVCIWMVTASVPSKIWLSWEPMQLWGSIGQGLHCRILLNMFAIYYLHMSKIWTIPLYAIPNSIWCIINSQATFWKHSSSFISDLRLSPYENLYIHQDTYNTQKIIKQDQIRIIIPLPADVWQLQHHSSYLSPALVCRCLELKTKTNS